MNATTVAVDLAKSVFALAVADEHWKVVERARLTRGQFERWFHNRAVRLVVMEACATAHYWARTLRARGIEVRLLPAKYVRAYVKRNKTDAADALALLEAARGSDIARQSGDRKNKEHPAGERKGQHDAPNAGQNFLRILVAPDIKVFGCVAQRLPFEKRIHERG